MAFISKLDLDLVKVYQQDVQKLSCLQTKKQNISDKHIDMTDKNTVYMFNLTTYIKTTSVGVPLPPSLNKCC